MIERSCKKKKKGQQWKSRFGMSRQKRRYLFNWYRRFWANKSYARASAGTREKIERAASELGYQPNISARILQGGAQ